MDNNLNQNESILIKFKEELKEQLIKESKAKNILIYDPIREISQKFKY